MNHFLVNVTYPVLFLALFANQLSMPVPGPLFLLAAGALCQTRQLNFPLCIVISLVACLLGDTAWYFAGRRYGSRILRLLASFSSDPRAQILQSRRTLQRFGLRSLLIAKFIPGINAIAPPLAGVMNARLHHFLLYDAAGALLWSLAYAGTGFLFSRQVQAVAAFVTRFGGIPTVLLGVPIALYMAWKTIALARVARQLSLSRISPDQLRRKIAAGSPLLMVDLLNYEDESVGIDGIPGSVRLDPSKLRTGPHVLVPKGLDVVIYSASPNHFRSARVAMALREHGVPHVLLLDGGLNAWRERGLPVTSNLEDPLSTLLSKNVVFLGPVPVSGAG